MWANQNDRSGGRGRKEETIFLRTSPALGGRPSLRTVRPQLSPSPNCRAAAPQ